jgi:hypothetical protein
MKNIHVLPTDKPSRLYNNNGQLHLDSVLTTSNGHTINQHLYITSDEKIKKSDFFYVKTPNIHGGNIVTKCLNIGKGCWSEHILTDTIDEKGYHPSHCKKIILTTDQDLIKDGVQAIDNEFLEWFVKNPSCESVKVEDYGNFYNFRYLILIPQETLSTKLHIGEVVDESYPEAFRKQETLEDAAKRTYQKGLQDDIDLSFYDGVRLGAQWKAERMYSEDEVLNLLIDMNSWPTTFEGKEDITEWFEQSKTK